MMIYHVHFVSFCVGISAGKTVGEVVNLLRSGKVAGDDNTTGYC